jgi:hypothetical protein
MYYVVVDIYVKKERKETKKNKQARIEKGVTICIQWRARVCFFGVAIKLDRY